MNRTIPLRAQKRNVEARHRNSQLSITPHTHGTKQCDNILLTEELSPRIADLGEARMAVDGKTMTTVGTHVGLSRSGV